MRQWLWKELTTIQDCATPLHKRGWRGAELHTMRNRKEILCGEKTERKHGVSTNATKQHTEVLCASGFRFSFRTRDEPGLATAQRYLG